MKIVIAIIILALSIALGGTTSSKADTLRTATGSYDYAKGYSKKDCRGGHIVPVYPSNTEHGLKAFKLKPGTTAIWSWYTVQGSRVGFKELRSTDKCHKLHGNTLRDKVVVRKA